MLLGQDFRGSHQGALPTGIYAAACRQRRHHGFARPHVALQQPVHGHVARQIGRNFLAHALLRGCKFKGQGSQQLGVQSGPI